jgi:hypothetical protein
VVHYFLGELLGTWRHILAGCIQHIISPIKVDQLARLNELLGGLACIFPWYGFLRVNVDSAHLEVLVLPICWRWLLILLQNGVRCIGLLPESVLSKLLGNLKCLGGLISSLALLSSCGSGLATRSWVIVVEAWAGYLSESARGLYLIDAAILARLATRVDNCSTRLVVVVFHQSGWGAYQWDTSLLLCAIHIKWVHTRSWNEGTMSRFNL